MNYLIVGGVVLAFIITVFLLLIFMPKPVSYFSIDTIYKELKILEIPEHITDIVEEMKEFNKNIKA